MKEYLDYPDLSSRRARFSILRLDAAEDQKRQKEAAKMAKRDVLRYRSRRDKRGKHLREQE